MTDEEIVWEKAGMFMPLQKVIECLVIIAAGKKLCETSEELDLLYKDLVIEQANVFLNKFYPTTT